MVFIPPSNPDRITAYMALDVSPEDLEGIKQAFELGACSRFSPILEMVIKDEPSYHKMSHPDIRRAEDEAGRAEPFVVIDQRAISDGAVWYVDAFATDDQVEDGAVESTKVLLEILVKTECLALTYVNYDIANMDIVEDLGNCGAEIPLSEGYEQETISDCGGLDMKDQERHQAVWVTAEPGEFEESTDPDKCGRFMPRPEKVARLLKKVAEENGIIADWTIPSPVKTRKLRDGTEKTFPDGSVVLQHKWDPDFPWPKYRWPEDSL
ncbi:hypothetical protein CPLU01_06728 [Colletotrichum plurivorum]|uniref:Uncharacterized protein n=1 Tax=Colletotrichum plurivorum TaxID=2175906 RepID=A0A8H6KI83_9PEZI|nr:hypothetical protein CPLU01_06728 [Colletotrichum plurivorum]